MKREYSLTNKKIIDIAFKKHDSKGSHNFVLYKLVSNENHFRFLISIGRKYGNSVHRNLMKRRIRAIIGNLQEELENYYLVIVVKPTSKSLEFLEIKRELTSLLQRSKVIKET